MKLELTNSGTTEFTTASSGTPIDASTIRVQLNYFHTLDPFDPADTDLQGQKEIDVPVVSYRISGNWVQFMAIVPESAPSLLFNQVGLTNNDGSILLAGAHTTNVVEHLQQSLPDELGNTIRIFATLDLDTLQPHEVFNFSAITSTNEWTPSYEFDATVSVTTVDSILRRVLTVDGYVKMHSMSGRKVRLYHETSGTYGYAIITKKVYDFANDKTLLLLSPTETHTDLLYTDTYSGDTLKVQFGLLTAGQDAQPAQAITLFRDSIAEPLTLEKDLAGLSAHTTATVTTQDPSFKWKVIS